MAGFIHIYYGNGKGKTSILNGSAIRAVSRNLNIEYLSFLKNIKGGEFSFFQEQLKNKINFHSFYSFSSKFIWEMNDEERKQFKKESLVGVRYLEKIIKSKKIDLIICDEILDLVINEIITQDELCRILQTKSENVEIMLSGHKLPNKCKEIADLISEVNLVKHYFDRGIKARKGIEF